MNISNSLESVKIKPLHPAVGTVIWLHGLGADGHDFADIVPQLNLPADLPLRFIFPHAPIRPVTLNGNIPMRAWFDLYSLEKLEQADKTGILQTEAAIATLIEEEIASGIESHRIVLAGFSQGGAMALYAGLRYPKPLAGILGLSTYLPMSQCIEAEKNTANKQTPILMAHGRFDAVLSVSLGKSSYELLKKLGYPIKWLEYPMEHQVCAEEVTAIGQWLTDILAL